MSDYSKSLFMRIPRVYSIVELAGTPNVAVERKDEYRFGIGRRRS
jgi:hypothetical protein